MGEQPIFLGADERLLGIITSPDPATQRVGAPAVLLLNAGLIHRVGPNRLNVELARNLGEAGFTAVRFDMSGIGDSDRPSTELSYLEQTMSDLTETMDTLSALKNMPSRFVTVGLCTGAYNCLLAATRDPRIIGAVLIDGYAYPTKKYEIRRQLRRVTQGWRWKRYLKRKLGIGAPTPPVRNDDVFVFQPEDLEAAEFGERLNRLVERGVRLHISYTGYGPQPYNYQNQLWDAFPDLDRSKISLEYIADANHTFTVPAHRWQLIESIRRWMESEFDSQRVAGG